MSEADSSKLWYCWSCDREWNLQETGTKTCPDCRVHGVRKDDLG